MDTNNRLLAYAERMGVLKRLNVSLDEELHTQLKVMVAEKKTTIAQFVVDAIKEKIEREKGSN